MPNYKITLEYDGTNYVGWQRQENGPSIQQLVEEAIEKLSKQKVFVSFQLFCACPIRNGCLATPVISTPPQSSAD